MNTSPPLKPSQPTCTWKAPLAASGQLNEAMLCTSELQYFECKPRLAHELLQEVPIGLLMRIEVEQFFALDTSIEADTEPGAARVLVCALSG